MAHEKFYGICENKCKVRLPRIFSYTVDLSEYISASNSPKSISSDNSCTYAFNLSERFPEAAELDRRDVSAFANLGTTNTGLMGSIDVVIGVSFGYGTDGSEYMYVTIHNVGEYGIQFVNGSLSYGYYLNLTFIEHV